MKKSALAAVSALTAAPALAHEGHSAARELGALHWLTEADHLAPILVTGIVILALVALRLSRRE